MSGSAKVIGAIDIGTLFCDVEPTTPEGYHSCAEIAKAAGRATSTVSKRMTAARRAGEVEGLQVVSGCTGGNMWVYRVNL